MSTLNQVKQLLSICLMAVMLLIAPLSVLAAELVDINRANAATMIENWKGIGEKKARAIVDYRNKNGKFASINDLANVPGMGEVLIKNNRKYMSVTKGASKPTGKTTAKKSTSTKKDKTATAKTSKKSSDSKSKDTKTSKSTKNKSKKTKKDSTSKKKGTSKKKSTDKKKSKKKKVKTS